MIRDFTSCKQQRVLLRTGGVSGVRITILTRDEQECMRIAVCEHSVAGNLAGFIDVQRHRQCHIGVVHKSVQVDGRSAVFP